MEDHFVSGVGDEVVLFVAFLILAFSLLLTLSFWSSRRRAIRETIVDGVSRTVQQDHHEPDHLQQPEPSSESYAHLRHRGHVRQEPEETSHVGVAPSSEGETVRLKLMMLDRERSVVVSSASSLQQLQRTHFSTELAQGRSVRFIYHGRELTNLSMTLEDLGIQDHSAIHVHIGQIPEQQNQNRDTVQQAGQDQILDLSWLFAPLFGLMLAVVWACFLQWPSAFSLLTKVALFVLSLGYVLLAYYTYY